MKMKAGRKPDYEIDEHILEALTEFPIMTTEYIRRRIYKREGRLISWETIQNHLNRLAEDRKVSEKIVSKGKKRTIRVYSLIQ